MLDNHIVLNPTNTTNNVEDLDSHIRSSRDEESLHRHDLEELRRQQMLEMQEQRDRDLQSRLDGLRDSVRKRRVQQQEQAEVRDGPPDHGHSNLNGVADTLAPVRKRGNRVLDKPLFRSVSGTSTEGKRGKGDIDPDLQGMLDRVKGLEGRDGERGVELEFLSRPQMVSDDYVVDHDAID
ncbi:MAG: hypothetical protein Q9222_005709 [Ikaeria aurantiellina]